MGTISAAFATSDWADHISGHGYFFRSGHHFGIFGSGSPVSLVVMPGGDSHSSRSVVPFSVLAYFLCRQLYAMTISNESAVYHLLTLQCAHWAQLVIVTCTESFSTVFLAMITACTSGVRPIRKEHESLRPLP